MTTTTARPTADNRMLARWKRLSALPAGRRLFSYSVGRMARYTGTIRPLVRELRAGYCKVEMRDRAALRNHLSSLHAVALLNLGEVTSGLALLAGLPDDSRGIVTSLSIEFLKKARGTIAAECACPPPGPAGTREERELEVVALLRDTAGDVVARITARWKVGPRP